MNWRRYDRTFYLILRVVTVVVLTALAVSFLNGGTREQSPPKPGVGPSPKLNSKPGPSPKGTIIEDVLPSEPRTQVPSTPAPPVPVPPRITKTARMAIIIDDLGCGVPGTRELMEIERPITVAVLPYRPHTVGEAKTARSRGFEVLLHLPMEPDDEHKNPGKGAITVTMTDEEVTDQVVADLGAVPCITGVNNHMGSKATADPRIMAAVLKEIRARDLVFVDSMTSRRSVAGLMAQEQGIPALRNQMFIDNENDINAIKNRIRMLARIALRRGKVVGIGHVRPATVEALREMIPELEAAGIKLVKVSELAFQS